MRIPRFAIIAVCYALAALTLGATTVAEPVADAIAAIRTTSPTTGSSDDARKAWETLAAADATDIPAILRGMTDSNPAVENWLRSATDAVASRTLSNGGQLPQEALVALLADTTVSPRGRRTAYELLEQIDADQAHRLLTAMINDPSLEMRYDAVAANIKIAEAATGDEKRQLFAKLFDAARNLDQIKTCKTALEELGATIDLATHMGFITSWRIVGMFDNSDKAGYDVAYPPEGGIDFSATYDGKDEQAAWRDEPVTTDDDLGNIDLNDALGAKKGVIVYAYAEINVAAARTATVRYTSPNATKLWVNGKLSAANEVYHAGGEVDQYLAPVQLVDGINTILLKVCQNEQTDPWAQNWNFQLRVTDELGGAIQATQGQKQ